VGRIKTVFGERELPPYGTEQLGPNYYYILTDSERNLLKLGVTCNLKIRQVTLSSQIGYHLLYIDYVAFGDSKCKRVGNRYKGAGLRCSTIEGHLNRALKAKGFKPFKGMEWFDFSWEIITLWKRFLETVYTLYPHKFHDIRFSGLWHE